jgi:hypothetical protein
MGALANQWHQVLNPTYWMRLQRQHVREIKAANSGASYDGEKYLAEHDSHRIRSRSAVAGRFRDSAPLERGAPIMKTTNIIVAFAAGTLLVPFAIAQEVIRETVPAPAPAATAVPEDAVAAAAGQPMEMAGTVALFGDHTFAVRTDTASTPVNYIYSANTRWVDEAGNVLTRDSVREGVPVTVHYMRGNQGLLVSKVIVRRQVTPAPTTVETITPQVTETRETAIERTKSEVREKREPIAERPAKVTERRKAVVKEQPATEKRETIVVEPKVVEKPAPPVVEKNTTTTTTTTEKKKKDNDDDD